MWSWFFFEVISRHESVVFKKKLFCSLLIEVTDFEGTLTMVSHYNLSDAFSCFEVMAPNNLSKFVKPAGGALVIFSTFLGFNVFLQHGKKKYSNGQGIVNKPLEKNSRLQITC